MQQLRKPTTCCQGEVPCRSSIAVGYSEDPVFCKHDRQQSGLRDGWFHVGLEETVFSRQVVCAMGRELADRPHRESGGK